MFFSKFLCACLCAMFLFLRCLNLLWVLSFIKTKDSFLTSFTTCWSWTCRILSCVLNDSFFFFRKVPKQKFLCEEVQTRILWAVSYVKSIIMSLALSLSLAPTVLGSNVIYHWRRLVWRVLKKKEKIASLPFGSHVLLASSNWWFISRRFQDDIGG